LQVRQLYEAIAPASAGMSPAVSGALMGLDIAPRDLAMSVPSQMSLRRIPNCLHLTIRIAYASAWEALIRTHTDQAVQFIHEFAPRVAPLTALELYFRVVAVPDAMQEVVRTRTLTSLEVDTLAPLAAIPSLRGWQRLRLDLVLEHRRYRRRHQESTLQLARMVGARAAEAAIATHVHNAMEFCGLVRGVLTVEQATDHYLREFSLSSSAAHMVSQRVQARVVGQELTAHDDGPLPRVPASAASAPRPTPQAFVEAVERHYDLLELEARGEIQVGGAEGTDRGGVAGAEPSDLEPEHDGALAPEQVAFEGHVPEPGAGVEIGVVGIVDAGADAELPARGGAQVELAPSAGGAHRHAVADHVLADAAAAEPGERLAGEPFRPDLDLRA